MNPKGAKTTLKRKAESPAGGGPGKKQAQTGADFKKKRPVAAADQRPRNGNEAPRMKTSAGSSSGKSAKTVLSRKEHKEQVAAKKLALKKNFPLIQGVVTLWEKSRPKALSKSDREALVSNILSKVRGKVCELSNHHSGSRVIQFCAKNGNETDRAALMEEVHSNIVDLSKSKYAHHLVRKLINVSKREEVPGLFKLFRGRIPELLRHPYGSDVLMDLYDVCSSAQRNAMCAEFYGREYSVFDQHGDSAPTSLKQLLASVEAPKRRTILIYMSKLMLPIMEKALLHPPMTHRLLREFLECAPGSSVEDAVDTLTQTGSSVLKMVHTHDGAAAACMLLAYASAKERKQLIKGMKGLVKDMAMNEWGHAVLCTAVTVTDDTELVRKVILAELKEDLEALLGSKFSRCVFLQLLSPDNHRYFPPHILQMMHPSRRTVKGEKVAVETGDGDEEDVDFGPAAEGDENGGDLLQAKKRKKTAAAEAKGAKRHKAAVAQEQDTVVTAAEDMEQADQDAGQRPAQERVLGESKKDPLVRRRELLGSGPSGLGQRIAELCAAQAGGMLRSATAADVVVEVCRGGDAGVLNQVAASAVAAVHDRVAAEAARSPEDDSNDAPAEMGPAPRTTHVLIDWHGSRALRRLLLASSEEGPAGQCASECARKIWSQALRGHCKQWMGSHAEKVLAALLRCGAEEVRMEASKELQKLLPKGTQLEQWAEGLLAKRDAPATASSAPAAAADHASIGLGKDVAQGKPQRSSTPGSAHAEKEVAAGEQKKAKRQKRADEAVHETKPSAVPLSETKGSQHVQQAGAVKARKKQK